MQTIPWRRYALGAIALVLLAAGVAVGWLRTAPTDWALTQGVCIKTGTTLLMCWLAYPQLQRLSPWKLASVLAGAAILIFRPQLIPVVVRLLVFLAPILFLIWLLRTPAGSRSKPG